MTALIYDIWSGFGTQAKPFVGCGRYAMGPPGVSHIWCDHLAPEIQPLSVIFKLFNKEVLDFLMGYVISMQTTNIGLK
jgi:hypothetical protein